MQSSNMIWKTGAILLISLWQEESYSSFSWDYTVVKAWVSLPWTQELPALSPWLGGWQGPDFSAAGREEIHNTLSYTWAEGKKALKR